MERIMKVVECCDHKQVYGYLIVKDVSGDEVQKKIYEIKRDETFKEECPDWCVTDIFERFPKEWEWEYIVEDCTVEIQ